MSKHNDLIVDAHNAKDRLEYLRGEIQNERISYPEIVELQSLAGHIEPSDTELLQWAGVAEYDTDKTSAIISDTEARRIASEWHGGGGTALYAFASTGAIDTARADHNIRGEIGTNLIWLTGVFHPTNHPYDDQPVTRDGFTDNELHELVALRTYTEHHRSRGPMAGWATLTW